MIYKKQTKIISLFVTLCFCNGCMQSKTSPLYQEREAKSQREIAFIENTSKNIPSRLTFEEIVEIATVQNLDLYVKELEWNIQKEAATGAILDTVPELLYQREQNARNNNPGSSSASLDPGVPPAPPSVSSQKHDTHWNFTLTWNLLDFGISYFKARKEVDGILIKKFEYEKVKNKVILDLSLNFWAAVAAKEAINKAEALIENLTSQRILLTKAANQHFIPQTRVLFFQEKILDNQIKIKEYQRDYDIAMGELRRLMGVAPDTEFELIYDPMRPSYAELPEVDALETIALNERPEFFANDVQERMSRDQVYTSLIKLFPALSLFTGKNYDSNKYLIKNYWNLLGVRAVFDLLSIPSGLADYDVSKAQVSLTKRNEIALAQAALCQLHIAYLTYLDDRDRYLLTAEYEDNQLRQLKDAEQKKRAGSFDLLDLLEFEVRALDAEIRAWKAYSDSQYALEQLNNAIGIPLHFKNHPSRNEIRCPADAHEIVHESSFEKAGKRVAGYDS